MPVERIQIPGRDGLFPASHCLLKVRHDPLTWLVHSLWRIGGNFQSHSQDKQEEAVMMVY